jgi:hypothetical protein
MPLMEKVPDFYCQIQFVTFKIMSELCVIAFDVSLLGHWAHEFSVVV